ncbi:MAG TPA: beta-ketoacyl synthase N-terminal-like domain-containing protein, partial [Gemmatimonadaceae bacterium]|nr:beta-ketoacyl synthase N-terminal-like domain-containing protein [Gemmatimonadaceae bacterium]
MADRRRVVITGIGAVTPIGISRDGLWDGLQSHRSAVRPVSRFDASMFRSQIAAEIDFYPSDFIEERRVKRLDRFGQFTVACARLAIEDAELNLAAEDRERI